jgi:D-alanyl-D-alanine carboxypeptidase (penicillin-binding protein 5/6)
MTALSSRDHSGPDSDRPSGIFVTRICTRRSWSCERRVLCPPLMRRALLAVVMVAVALAAPVRASNAEPTTNGPQVQASSWYLAGEDGAVLARHDAARPRAIASITKLMTAAVVLEHAGLDDVVRVDARAARIGESTVYLRPDEELTVADLLRALLIPSANDAAEALALYVGRGSADRFVELMNAKARELGLSDTHFENPHGLDERGHVSSARDVTALIRYALGIPFIRETLQHETVSLPGGRTFSSTDDLLGEWRPLVGGKTGHTGDAGWSEAAAATRGGATVYGAVLGSDGRATRNDALRELLTYGLSRYRRVQVVDGGRVYAEAKTGYGQPAVELVALRPAVRPVRVGTPLVERVVAPTTLALPVARGERLGRIEVYEGNRLLASSDLVAADAVGEAGVLAKARWYTTQTARNLWEMLT